MRLRQKVVILLSSVCFYILGTLSKGVLSDEECQLGVRPFISIF